MNNTHNNPGKMERNVTIAQDRLAGKTYAELAELHKVSKATISRVLNDDEIRAVLKQGTNELVSMVPLAVNNYLTILSDTKHSDFYKASKDTLQNTGILSSHTGGNTYIENMLVVSDGPQAKDVLRIQELLQARQEADIQEAEVIEDEAA
jgi:hypothetical protein